MILPIHNSRLPKFETTCETYRQHFPSLSVKFQEAEKELADHASVSETWKNAASILTKHRGYPALLISHSHATSGIKVESASGILANTQYFPVETVPMLMGKAIGEARFSVHIPDISMQSGNNNIFLINDELHTLSVSLSSLKSIFPEGFAQNKGSILITPLGIEHSTPLGFGVIYEYSENEPLSIQSIKEARAYSALFMLDIAKKSIAGH